MALLENDVSWHVLRRILRDFAGTAAELDEVRALAGGSINTTLLLTTADRRKFVLKISSHRVNRELIREAHQLQTLRRLGIPTPTVLGCELASLDHPDSWLLLDYVDGLDLQGARQHCSDEQYDYLQEELAEICLHLHRTTHRHYHRDGDPEAPYFDEWPSFFRHIYDVIWQDVEEAKILSAKAHRQMGAIHEKLEDLLLHEDRPRLIHGDFWSANVLCSPNGDGRWHIAAILDPNLKFAHAESELAYLELFHTITPSFLKRYQQQQHISDAYHRFRRDLYHLYDLLDHVHLFGNEYVKPFTAALEKLGHVTRHS